MAWLRRMTSETRGSLKGSDGDLFPAGESGLNGSTAEREILELAFRWACGCLTSLLGEWGCCLSRWGLLA